MEVIQPKKTWWSRNWKWVVPVGCGVPLLIVLMCGGLIYVIFSMFLGMIKETDAYKDSLTMVQQNPAVQVEIGTPIEPGYMVFGKIEMSGNSSGFADFSYPVTGPNGEGWVYVVAEKTGGRWEFKLVRFESTMADIDLVTTP